MKKFLSYLYARFTVATAAIVVLQYWTSKSYLQELQSPTAVVRPQCWRPAHAVTIRSETISRGAAPAPIKIGTQISASFFHIWQSQRYSLFATKPIPSEWCSGTSWNTDRRYFGVCLDLRSLRKKVRPNHKRRLPQPLVDLFTWPFANVHMDFMKPFETSSLVSIHNCTLFIYLLPARRPGRSKITEGCYRAIDAVVRKSTSYLWNRHIEQFQQLPHKNYYSSLASRRADRADLMVVLGSLILRVLPAIAFMLNCTTNEP